MKKRKICVHFSDRFIMRALFTRKMDLDRAEKLLQKNWAWRKKYGLEELPRFEELEVGSLWKSGFCVPGVRDKEGRMVFYLFPGLMDPRQIPAEGKASCLI